MTETPLEKPRLRAVEPTRVTLNGAEYLLLKDPLSLCGGNLCVPVQAAALLALMDGVHSILDIQADFSRRIGYLVRSEDIRELTAQLDDSLLLEGPRFRAAYADKIIQVRRQPSRPAAHAGLSYSDDPIRLRVEIDAFFTDEGGPGAPEFFTEKTRPVGLIAPHIDLRAGGATLAHGYHSLMRGEPSDLYIILGTGHAGIERLFTAATLDFDTPLGRVETDREFLHEMNQALGRDCAAEELIHGTEHSVEFQAVFLQHLLAGRRRFKIFPILCSWPHHVLSSRTETKGRRIFDEFTGALRRLCENRSVCFVASADLDHIGPRYGDGFTPHRGTIDDALDKDRRLMGHLERLDFDAFVRDVAVDDDARRICGFSPVTAMLASTDASVGRLLRLDHTVVDNRNSFVTFASMIFH